ncbi:putative acyltransferase [Rhizobium leguminosarum bv. trifolii WSM2297]|uniref:Putative acyltransferase n=1 Tax=Rhizobium leguminosarum bv. trifolii WSM2297 TaxID=754762 RepID=J0W0W4_RHILT|nr:acyltransferase [Rhizobium leguminosarum]EJC78718.1 putative acyltransferase [Rhizobium leguminosarum bv. trifolii WSM2297]
MQRLDHRPGEETLLTTADALGRSAFPVPAYTGPTDAQDLGRGTDLTKDRFIFLDRLRGIAALSVALLHASQVFGFNLNSHAYLAVDFFFCLSGFVLANAYDQKLRSGILRSPVFLLKRMVRLYPMIVVGVGLGVLALQVAYGPGVPLADVSILAVGALLLLPVGFLVGQEAFAINNPLWSIFFEIVAGVIYGSVARRRIRFWHEIAALASLAAALFAVVSIEGTIGPVGFGNLRAFFEGFIRTGFSFLAGILIFRWQIIHRIPAVRPQIPLFVLMAVLFFPFAVPRDIYDFFCIAVIIPIVVALAAAVAQTEEKSLAAYLGQLSYPLYIVHLPVIQLGSYFQSATNSFIPLPIAVICTLLAAVAGAHFLYTQFDRPIRAYLSRRFSLN